MKPSRPAVALIIALACGINGARPGKAGLTEREIAAVALAPPPGARVPPGLMLRDATGRNLSWSEALGGRPALLVPADFTCQTLCGPALTMTAGALADSGLRAGIDYHLIVWGFDSKDTAADARAMIEARIVDRALASAALVLQTDGDATATLAGALGFRAAYDPESDQYAHREGALALTGDGRVARVLSILALTGTDLRYALIEAGEGKIGTLADRLATLCSSFDPVHGVYTLAVRRLLEVAGVVTVALLLGAVLFLHLRARARPEEA